MANVRASLLLCALTWAGCATAGDPRLVPGVDAATHDSAHADAPAADAPATIDAPRTVDAPQGIDAAPIDAPSGSCANPVAAGVIATYTFTGETGSQTSTMAATSHGVTAGPISRVGVTATSGANSINSVNWSIATSLDATKYYTLTLTVPSGCALDLTSVAIDAKASGSGPGSGAIATSADAFGGTTSISTAAATPSAALSVANATGTVELRVYGIHATSTSGTLRIQNTLSLTGSVH